MEALRDVAVERRELSHDLGTLDAFGDDDDAHDGEPSEQGEASGP
ncbi:MAG TPA: hypothetical protein VFX51_22940 [Solirubrobacteraceae bacterium]|nr:hypothetical protein [Solirubrobacteraceae bacterium]